MLVRGNQTGVAKSDDLRGSERFFDNVIVYVSYATVGRFIFIDY